MSPAARRFLALSSVAVLVLSAVLSVPTGHAHAETGDGDGSEFDPFRIGSVEDLRRIGTGDRGLDKHYVQTADIQFPEDDSPGVTVSSKRGAQTTVFEADVKMPPGLLAVMAVNEFITECRDSDENIRFTVPNDVFLDESLVSVYSPGTPGTGNTVSDTAWSVSFVYRQKDSDSFTMPTRGNFSPIGSEGDPFTGAYDGAGFRISGIRVMDYKNGDTLSGLFGYAEGAVIRNVSLEGTGSAFSSNSFYQSLRKDGAYESRECSSSAGSICAHATGTLVENCRSNCIVTSCTADISKAETRSNGGPHRNIVSISSFAGGLVGEAYDCTIKSSSFSGAVTSVLFDEKGLIFTAVSGGSGQQVFDLKMDQSGTSCLGGIVGKSTDSDMIFCANDSDPAGGNRFFSGRTNESPDLEGSDISITVEFTCSRGGITGSSKGDRIIGCRNSGEVFGEEQGMIDATGMNPSIVHTGSQDLGGIAGMLNGTEVVNCLNTGQAGRPNATSFQKSEQPRHCIGGIAGFTEGRAPTVRNCFSDSGPAVRDSGGVIGAYAEPKPFIGGTYFTSDLSVFSNGDTEEDIGKTMLWKKDKPFRDEADWDFERMWVVGNDNKPRLQLRYNLIFEYLHPGVSIDVDGQAGPGTVFGMIAPAAAFRISPDADAGSYFLLLQGSGEIIVPSAPGTVHVTPDADEHGSVKDLRLRLSRHKVYLSVDWQMENMSMQPTDAVRCMQSLSTRVTAAPGYKLPEDIEVFHGKTRLGTSQYSFDPETGEIVVPNVREDISIRAAAVPVGAGAGTSDGGGDTHSIAGMLDMSGERALQSVMIILGLLVSIYGLRSIRN